MAKKPADPSANKSKRRMGILMALSIAGAGVLKMSFLFFFIGMIPAMVAYIVDHDPKKYTSYTVAALNFAGMFPYMMDVYAQGGTLLAIKDRLTDPLVWFVMYGSAGLGWVIVHCSPLIAAVVLDGLYKGRILHLEIQQKRAIEDWGKEVVGREE
ncbi:MAG TPA: hypothetical protein VFT64_01475 [Rickettsiales bacterium]|nr:hypothetical protein [Rickettsiales bacterium]